ncbi:hypothetical protein SJAG_05326 [Schizosaccharomyces japonicus yFS275]|uniref:STEEP1 domain-containing protein n=1 Tax=Schizosaccharomyces japonicus (strain yFS275 / FY16936) TaxID=402676 RepID=B6K639_SCHJY|nr:hypothetical protein SJAG_05326 [Schizosaccharomyces japonicus yFS275]EEB08993.2 hypothetical protein SJAG_05326 [Schizosaccharomyces japonicus yFS275]
MSSGYGYFCPCGQLCLTLPCTAETLRHREYDTFYVLDLKMPHVDHLTKDEPFCIVRKDGGYELRTALQCRRCGLTCAYALENAPGYIYLNPTLLKEKTVTL